MSFEEAVNLYQEKGKSFLVKSMIKHGFSKAVQQMLFEAIEKEQLVPKELSVTATKNTHASFEETLSELNKSLPGYYNKAKFLHALRVKTIDENLEAIKKGKSISPVALASINANTREIHRIFKQHIVPTWNKIDTLKALGKLPDEVDPNELPDDVQELVKMRNNLRSYISRKKKGAPDIKQSLEELESKKAKVELKLSSIGKAAN